MNEKSFSQREMYVVNLDLIRVFWLIAIGLFLITFFFLFGYWLGSDTKYIDSPKNSLSAKSDRREVVPLNEKEMKNLTNLKEVKKATDEALTSNKINEESKEISLNNEVEAKISSSYPSPQEEGRGKTTDIREREDQRRPRVVNEYERKSAKQDRQKNEKDNTKKERIIQRDTHLSSSKPCTIQISTNRVKQNAENLRDSLKQRGFPAYIVVKKNGDNDVRYFVRVGPFSSEEKAQDIRVKLQSLKEGDGSQIVNR